jgi:alkylhydroperoxidase/carboxymuconolactone decarboxylase family protein YurZ
MDLVVRSTLAQRKEIMKFREDAQKRYSEILDPKTRYLMIIACYMMEGHWQGLVPQVCNAKAAGATDEEIMEAAFIACYAVSKAKLMEIQQALTGAFASPAYQRVQRGSMS